MALEDQYDVVLNNRGYMLDRASDAYKHQSVPMVRAQADTGDKPGEQSLNPAGLWRRTQESWHHGSGQEYLDRPDSSPYRFDASAGVDPWTKHQLGLLKVTELVEASTDTNLYLATSSNRLFMSEGQTIRVTGASDTTFADATGEPAVAVTALASDGTTVYAGFGASGVYKNTPGAPTVFSSYATGTVGLVRYTMGRLMVSSGPALYNVTAAGALPAALFPHPNASWVWTDMCDGLGHIYASGFAGDKSMVYKTAVKPDGTALDIPTVAATLPDGELAQSITGYLGYVVIGTDLGVRFAVPDADGNLTLGSLIDTDMPVMCGEGQGRFVWYGLTVQHGQTGCGLGRLDLTAFTSDLTPAYANDLAAVGGVNLTVQAVVTYLGRRFFTVEGSGVFGEHATNHVASGHLSTGDITFGIPDYKRPIRVRTGDSTGFTGSSHTVGVGSEGSGFTDIGTSTFGVEPTTIEFPNDYAGSSSRYNLRITLTAPTARSNRTSFQRITLFAQPIPDRTVMLQVPLLLADVVDDPDVVAERAVDVDAEVAAIEALFHSRDVVPYIRAGRTRSVIVDDFTFVPDNRSGRPEGETGTLLVVLKDVS